MGSELYKALHLLKFNPLVDGQSSLQMPRVTLTARIKPLQVSVQSVGTATCCPIVKKYNPSHLSAPPQVPGDCVSAEHFPTQLPLFSESTRPNKPLSSCVCPGQTGLGNANNLWGPAQETWCWRAGLGPWSSLGPSLLEAPREPSLLQHPKRSGNYRSMVSSSCLPWHLPTATRLSIREGKESYCMPLHSTIPQPMCVCAQLVHRTCSGGNQDESQLDVETEKGRNR